MAGIDGDVDLEEGECSDSGDEQISNMSTNTSIDKMYSFNTVSYHSRIPQIIINSDDSTDDSDDECPTLTKRSRSPSSGFSQNADWNNSSSQTFVSPFLNKGSMDTDAFVHNQQKKRKNSIWGSVLTEQVLSQEIKGFVVEKSDELNDYREVESYDYKRALDDDRPVLEIGGDEADNSKDDFFGGVVDLEKEVQRHESRKRKHNAKERLGRRSYDKLKPRNVTVSETDDVPTVVKAITTSMNEQNIDLFTRIVQTIGKDTAIKLFYMTEDVESAGGMLTNDGFRRRTPGGVYIQLLKSEPLVPKEKITEIFQDDEERWKEFRKEKRKIKKASRKKWKRKQKKITMDIDRPETPTPTEDLEVLSAIDSNNEFDASDLPERPATPEPKDDSSDGTEEEVEEEEEDISVAIANAKSAILKRQRELVKAGEGLDGGEVVIDEEGQSSPSCRSMTSMKDLDGKDDTSESVILGYDEISCTEDMEDA